MVASGLCDALINALLDEVLGATSHTADATLHFGLCTGVDASGTVTGEPTINTNGYVRKSITNDTNLWNTASGGSKTNKAAITWAAATGNWGSPTSLTTFFIANHASNTGSAILMYGTLDTAKTFTNGDTPSFAAGAMTVGIDQTT